MPADNAKQDFIYLSSRVLGDLHRQHAAGKRGAKLSGIGVLGNSIQGQTGTTQPENEYWLARHVTEAIRDNTGSLLDPGTYVLAKGLTTRWASVPFLQEQSRVAWFEAETYTSEGPVLVILCGSLPNLRGHVHTERPDGWWPSSAEGLGQVVRSFGHGNNDPRTLLRARNEEIPYLISTAYGIGDALADNCKIGDEQLDVLFEVFYYCDNFSVPERQFRRAFLGTPLWAALPEPASITELHASIEVGADGATETEHPGADTPQAPNARRRFTSLFGKRKQ